MSAGSPGADGRRFVPTDEALVEVSPWTINAWVSRPDLVPCKELLMVRAHMEPGRCHPFHCHPHREEIIYILSGRAEQWCGNQHRILATGDSVLIPKGEVHGTYNTFREPLVFLAILSPADAPEPAIVDVSREAAWVNRRTGLPECR